jgi:hypothetical protein
MFPEKEDNSDVKECYYVGKGFGERYARTATQCGAWHMSQNIVLKLVKYVCE